MSANTPTPNSPAGAGSSPSPLFGVCECGDRFPDISALMAHKLRHHMLEWPNVADAVKRLRVNLELQGARYITVRSDDVETLLGFAEKKPNDKILPTCATGGSTEETKS